MEDLERRVFLSAHVVGRHVFYNNSAFDGGDARAGAADDGAFAPDKTALLPGGRGGFANYTSYARGLNGLAIDIAGLAAAPVAADFSFKVGTVQNVSTWQAAPAPAEIAVRPGAGAGGSDRVSLVWTDNAIRNKWLQVTVLPTGNTGLDRPDVFYFGHLAGESGNTGANAAVTAQDVLVTNRKVSAAAVPIDSRWDFDRNRRVDRRDVAVARANMGSKGLRLLSLIGARLANDTGRSAADGLTSDPMVSGRLPDPGNLTRFTAGFDGAAPNTFADLLPDLRPDGTFVLTAARLAEIFGGPLGDGPRVLHFRADYRTGLETFDVRFTLDTAAPTAAFALDAASQDGAPNRTSLAAVTLAGTAEPGAVVGLSTGATTVAGGDGAFAFANVPVEPGATVFVVTATDAAGNAGTINRVIFRAAGPQPSAQVALDWNAIALAAIERDASTPEYASRSLAMLSAAAYDAANSIASSTSSLYVRVPAGPGASDIAAVAQAAHDALSYLYPAQRPAFAQLLATHLDSVAGGDARDAGVAVGGQVAAAIIAMRAGDGALGYLDYAPAAGPGEWQPTYPAYLPAQNPHWGALKPFLLASPDQFRPAGPPALDDARWQADYEQVRSLGRSDSTTRTADQTQAARFWNDPTGTATPPGHWNMIASRLAAERGLGLGDTIRLFAQLNVAMADAAIATWDAKFAFNFWRPLTAIIEGGGNAALAADPTWRPLLTTPPFPEYTSGHSTFSAAAATVLAAAFGAATPFSIGTTSPAVPAGATRAFASFDDAAAEAAMSRIYGGIHFNASVADGMTAGRAIGAYTLARFADQTDAVGPAVVYETPRGRATNGEFEITGLVADNLSGVASLTGRFDSGPSFPVDVDGSGRFYVLAEAAGEGAHVLRLTATDGAGNVSEAYDYAYAVDTREPTLSIAAPAPAAVLELGSKLFGAADGTGSPIVSFVYAFDFGAATPVVFDHAGAFDQFLMSGALSPGSHTLTVAATDAAGNQGVVAIAVTVPTLATTVLGVTPQDGSADVGVTFRPMVVFSAPVYAGSVNANSFFMTDGSGAKLPASVVVSDDQTRAFLFPTRPLPGASTITVTVDGSKLRTPRGGAVDAAFNNNGGGSVLSYRFTTVSLAPLAGTSLGGTVADPGADLKPGTKDDVQIGPDGVAGSADDVYRLPLAGVTVSILGTSLATVTDAAGRFFFPAVPAGIVKLDIDGNTATNAPDGYYFPSMVMDLDVAVGSSNTVMGAMQANGMGNAPAGAAAPTAPGVYLPRLLRSILTDVTPFGVTVVGLDPASAPGLTDERRNVLSLEVSGGVAVGPDGRRLGNFRVGVSAVPPQLVADMLPPGVMQHTFDITVQAPGVAAFSMPVPLTIPNVFGAAPGTHLDFLSFDHTTGRLVIEGTATVSADGLSVRTDPGTGITHPGWHGVTPPGACAGSGGPPPEPPEPVPGEVETKHDPVALPFITGEQAFELLDKKWEAPKSDRRPPPPPAGCAVPPRASGTQFVNVTIEVDGPLDKFTFPRRDTYLPLESQSFTLTEGSGETKKFGMLPSNYDLMYGSNGFAKLEQDELYGAAIKITEVRQLADGSRTRDVYTYYSYRWVDAVDATQAQARTGDTAAFLKTQTNNGLPFDRTKTVAYHLPETVSTKILGASAPFEVEPLGFGDGISTWHFRPTAAGGHQDAVDIVADQSISDLNRREVGEITLKGTGIKPTKINVNLQGFKDETIRLIKDLVQGPGPDGTFGNADDRIGYVYQANNPDADFVEASDNFKNAFRGFWPSDHLGPDGIYRSGDDNFTIVQEALLYGRVSEEADHLLEALRGKYFDLNQSAGVLLPYQFDDSPGDVEITYADLGPSVAGRADYDINGSLLPAMLADPALPEAAKAWALAEGLNHSVQNTGKFSPSIHIKWTAGMTFGAKVANVMAHEIGHTFGLNDAYSKDGGVHDVDPQPDLMNSFSAGDGPLTFGADNITLLQAAMGFAPNGPGALASALAMYRKNFNLPGSETGLQEEADPGRTLAEIGVLGPGAPPASRALTSGTTLSLGEAVVGQTVTTSLTLVNPTPFPLTIGTIGTASAGSGFAASGPAAGAVIPGNASATLTLTFTPASAGGARDTLFIHSNAAATPTFSIRLDATGVPATPSARIAAADNNLGGVAVGRSLGRGDVVTIFNDGAQPLRITSVTLSHGAPEFALAGLPADLAANPVVLARGQSFQFGASFSPTRFGLARDTVTIVTNDPSHPTLSVGLAGTGVAAVPRAEWGNDFVAVTTRSNRGANTVRVRSDSRGNFNVFLPAETPYEIAVFDPGTGLITHGSGVTAASGRATDLTATLVFRASTAPDSDGDGLPDDVEDAVGTAPARADTDGDGLDDATEIAQGLDPFGGRAFPTGVVATLPLRGEAKAVVMEGSSLDPQGQTAYVATGAYGLAVVDLTRFQQPVALAQLDLPGDAVDVAVDSRLGIAAVANLAGGLHLIDVSDPGAPRFIRTITDTFTPLPVSQVEVLDGVAYASLGSELVSYDLLTGNRIDTLRGGGAIRGMAREGTFLFTLDADRVLRAVDVSAGGMAARGSLVAPFGNGRLFVGGGVAYLGAGAGFITVDVSNPNDLTLLSGVDANNIEGQAVVPNGSGMAVGVGSVTGPAGPIHGLDVLDVSDPSNTAGFVTRFDLPASPRSAVIGAGIAFIATGTAGLAVVNYLPFDNQGRPPSAALSTSAQDLDPQTPGIQVLEGTALPLAAVIGDDVQVRNVELIVNGQVVRNDVTFPFDLTAVALGPDGTTRVRVRATDTGGNTTVSDELVFRLMEDATPPAVVSITPAGGSIGSSAVRRATVEFSEVMDPATLVPGNFILVSAGGDGAFDTADDAPVPFTMQTRNGGRTVPLTFLPLGTGRYRLTLAAASLTDRAGNRLGQQNLASTFTLRLDDPGFEIEGATPSYGVGARPESIAAGDVDGDGDQDLVTANVAGDSVTVMFGDGAGGFESRVDFAVGDGPVSVAMGDVDGDGDLDLVTANSDASTVSVLLNDGAGTFGARADVAMGQSPSWVELGDVDRDGDLDLVVTVPSGNASGASVLRNNGAGIFGSRQDVNLGFQSQANSLALGDVDGDGDLDLVIAMDFSGVAVFRNNGAGAFGSLRTVALNSPRGIRLGDIDGDGDLDIVTGGANSQTLQTLRNIGAGTFGPGANYFFGFNFSTLVLADLDGDGDLDAAGAAGSASAGGGAAGVLRNDGAGGFGSYGFYEVGAPAAAIAVADLDGDGKTDLATASTNGNNISVLRNDGAAGFGPSLVQVGSRPFAVESGDLDGDGDLDLVTASPSGNNVSVLFNAGGGRMGGRVDTPVGTAPRALAVGDVDGDGDADVIAANSGSANVSVLRNDGAGAFAAAVNFPVGTGPRLVRLGDVDGDGDLDLVTANYSSGNVSVLFNNGSGGFAARTDFATVTQCSTLALGDVDGDGDLDLIAASESGNANPSLVMLTNDGAGRFGMAQGIFVGSFHRAVALADVDGDRDLDLVRLDSGLSFLRNDGTGNFPRLFNLAESFALPTTAQTFSLGDLDADGDVDVALINFSDHNVSVVRNDGSGKFGAPGELFQADMAHPVDYAVGSQPNALLLGDIDGDGDLDAVTANYNGSDVSVVTNDGTGAFGAPILPVGREPRSVALGDLNGDGHLDLVTGNFASMYDAITLRFGDGAGGFGDRVVMQSEQGITAVVLGDIDGDGDLDIVASSHLFGVGGPASTVLLNDGSGVFSGGREVLGSGNTRAQSVALGDMDGDGDLDIVTVNNPIPTGATVSVILNQGATRFAGRRDYAVPQVPVSLTLGDVDGDGDLDVVTANSAANNVSLLINDGRGGLGYPRIDVGGYTESVALGDVDGDGDTDVVVSRGIAVVLRNNGPAGFAVETTNRAVGRFIALGDVDGDGDLDLAGCHDGDMAMILLNDGSGAFGPYTEFAVGTTPRSVALGDVDGDGDLDLVTGNINSGNVSVLRNDGVGSFGSRADFAVGLSPLFVTWGDVDGDKDLDLITVSPTGNSVTVLRNDGAGGFQSRTDVTVGTTPVSLAAGDVDGDGDLDLVTANAGGNTVSVLRNDGIGVFGARSDLVVGAGPQFVVLRDVDGDGDADLVTSNSTAASHSLLRNNAGTFAARVDFALGTGGSAFTLGDFDGDGDADLVSAGEGVWLRRNDGAGVFESRVNYPAGSNTQALTLADVDADGDRDLIVGSSSTSIMLLLNNGTGGYGTRVDLAGGGPSRAVAAADIDGDGDVDIISANGNGNGKGTVSILLNDGAGRFLRRLDYFVGSRQPRAIALGDVDGDGDLDIVTASDDDSSVSVLFVVRRN